MIGEVRRRFRCRRRRDDEVFEDAAMIGKFDGAAAVVVDDKVDDVNVIVCGIDVFTKDRERKKNREKMKYHFDECLFHEPIPHFLLSQPPSPYSLSKIGTHGQRRPHHHRRDYWE